MKISQIISVMFLIIMINVNYCYHNKYHVKNRLKNHYQIKLRLKQKVTFKYLNLHGLYKYNKIQKEDGKYVLSELNAADFYQQCIGEKQDAEKYEAQQQFIKIQEKLMKSVQKEISPAFQNNYWIYYVSNEGKCDVNSDEFGLQLMLLPKGDPRLHDYNDPNNRIGFVKVCYGQKGESYVLQNCAFDTCKTKKQQDNEIIVKENTKIKGNCAREVDEDESITIQNTSDKTSLRVVGEEQCNSLGRIIM